MMPADLDNSLDLSERSSYRTKRDVVLVSGSEAVSFLQGQVSQTVEDLDVGASRLSFVLQPQGKVDALMRVTRLDQDTLILDVDGGYGGPMIGSLERFRLRADIEFSLSDWSVVSVFGSPTMPADTPSGTEVVVENLFGSHLGVDLIGPDPVALAALGLKPDAYERLRIESGFPLMGVDMDNNTIPNETGLIDRAISLTKGCYRGQELVERISSRGVCRQLLQMVEIPASALTDGVRPPIGSELMVSDRRAGTITSLAPGEPLVGLVYVRGDADLSSGFKVLAPGLAGAEPDSSATDPDTR